LPADSHVGYTQEETIALASEVTMKQALSSPEKLRNDTMTEIKSVIRNDTWQLVDRPKDSITIGSRIVLWNKFNSDDSLYKCKTRLIVQGFNQQPGLHFKSSHPTGKNTSNRSVISLPRYTSFGYNHRLPNSDLKEQILMESQAVDRGSKDNLSGRKLSRSGNQVRQNVSGTKQR